MEKIDNKISKSLIIGGLLADTKKVNTAFLTNRRLACKDTYHGREHFYSDPDIYFYSETRSRCLGAVTQVGRPCHVIQYINFICCQLPSVAMRL